VIEFSGALEKLKVRAPVVVREIEILRIVARLDGDVPTAKEVILSWIERKTSKRLPDEAWTGDDFEVFNGGRHAAGVSLDLEQVSLWAVRSDDPDKHVPGRSWTHEVTIGGATSKKPFLTVRQLMTTKEQDYQIEAAVPSFVPEIAQKCGLTVEGRAAGDTPEIISTREQMDDFASALVDPARRVPIFALTAPAEGDSSQLCLIDAAKLAKATNGIARVVVIPPQLTWLLTERFGQKRSVFGGAIRSYLSGFSEDADPFDHRLIIADRLTNEDAQSQYLRWMRNLAALESRKYTRLGQDILAFTQIKSSKSSHRLEELAVSGASEAEQLEAIRANSKALQDQIERLGQENNYYVGEHGKIEERAEAAEAENRSLVFQVRYLREQLRSRAETTGTTDVWPSSNEDLLRWCDENLSGNLVIVPSARKGLKAAEFEDCQLIARCLKWLATETKAGFSNGAGGSLRDVVVEDGIWNTHCGSDSFDFDWNGRRLTAEWHIKNGGNTRDPKRCLRIYYAWDDDTEQVVVADLPAHRRTSAT
jgi:hypothetical protein